MIVLHRWKQERANARSAPAVAGRVRVSEPSVENIEIPITYIVLIALDHKRFQMTGLLHAADLSSLQAIP